MDFITYVKKEGYESKTWLIRGGLKVFKYPCQKPLKDQIWNYKTEVGAFFIMTHRVHSHENFARAKEECNTLMFAAFGILNPEYEHEVIGQSGDRSLVSFTVKGAWAGPSCLINMPTSIL